MSDVASSNLKNKRYTFITINLKQNPRYNSDSNNSA